MLRDAEKFDKALIIFTADHGAKASAWDDDNLQNVPPLIKRPYQSSPEVLHDLANHQLRDLLLGNLR